MGGGPRLSPVLRSPQSHPASRLPVSLFPGVYRPCRRARKGHPLLDSRGRAPAAPVCSRWTMEACSNLPSAAGSLGP